MYVVIVLEIESDVAGIDRAFGPFATYELARYRAESLKTGTYSENPELVQVSSLAS